MHTAKVYSIKEHRGAQRVFIEGKNPQKSGFEPGAQYSVKKVKDGVLLKLAEAGEKVRKVSKKVVKSTGKEVPVIDLNNREDLEAFKGCNIVRVIFGQGEVLITPVESELRRIERLADLKATLRNGEPLKTGGIACGGGIASNAMNTGLREAGLNTKYVLANEIRDALVEHAAEANEIFTDETVVLNMPLQELAYDKYILGLLKKENKLPHVTEFGLPCSGASPSGRSKLGLSMAEEHPEVGHLVAGAMALVAGLNSAAYIFENVPAYAKTASAAIMRRQLQDLGYDCHETFVFGPDYGDLEARHRWYMVAVTKGIEFNLADETDPPKVDPNRKLADVLEPPEAVAHRWSKMTGLKAKQERDIAAGKGFRMQIYTGEEQTINTLTKGLPKNRSTDPKIQHPDNPELLRIPTASEHALCKGIPKHLIEGLNETVAHELLGQSITFKAFVHKVRRLGRALEQWAFSDTEVTGSQLQFKFAA